MKRRRVAVGVALPVVALGAVAAVVLASSGGGAADPDADTAAVQGRTERVERRTLVEREEIDGTLGYGDPRPAVDRLGGTLTWLPRAGATIRPGQRLFAVDGEPVILMDGDVPAWRTLKEDVEDGEDVRQLEANLAALGYDPGTVDDDFTSSTADAVERWQDAWGLEETGEVELGRVVFLPGPRRIGEVTGSLGGTGSSGGGDNGTVAWDGGSTGGLQTVAVADTSGGATPTGTSTTPASTTPDTASGGGTETTPRDGGGTGDGGNGTGGSRDGAGGGDGGSGKGGGDGGRGGTGDGGSGTGGGGTGTGGTGTGGDGTGGDGTGDGSGDGNGGRGDGNGTGDGGKGDGGNGTDTGGGGTAGGGGGETTGAAGGGTTGGGAGGTTGGTGAGGGGTASGAGGGSGGGGTGDGAGSGDGVGAGAGTEVLETTSTTRVVTADLEAADQSLAKVGRKATIILPDGSSVGGRVTEVGTVVTGGGSGDGSGQEESDPTLPLTIELNRERGLGRLDEAPVTVELASTTRRNVLAVPVEALLAKAGGGYAVRVVHGTRAVEVEVDPGMFADGYVELTGGRVRAGDRIEVPE